MLCYGSGELIRDFVEATIGVLLENDIRDYQLVLVGNYLESCTDRTPEIVKEFEKEIMRDDFDEERFHRRLQIGRFEEWT